MTRDFRDYYYSVADRLDLYARVYSGKPGRTPLLCLHGLTRNSADFHDLLVQLPDWPAISVDCRGRGNSDYDPDPSRYQIGVYCQDVLILLEGLQHESVIAVGTSMGGLMTLTLANMRPGLFKAAIINDIGPEVDAAGLKRLQSYVGQATVFPNWGTAIAALQSQGPGIFPEYTAVDWRAFADRVCEETADGQVRFRYDPAINDNFKSADEAVVPPDLWSLYTQPKALPMLIIRGETSDILSEKTAAKMVEDRDEARLITVPNRGHAPMLTEAVAIDAIVEFLEPFA